MSDLHLEVGQKYATFCSAKAPYLILAGDIGRLADYEPYREFLRAQCDQFAGVYLVLGNHEFFGGSRRSGLELARKMEAEPTLQGRLTILNRRRVDVEGRRPVTILGCTLHSYVPAEAREVVERKINDFRRIADWTVAEHVAEHARDVEWLEREIKAVRDGEAAGAERRRIVVISHHAPSTRGTSNPAQADNPWSSAFGTDLLRTRPASGLDDVQWWIFGHTHHSTQLSVGATKLVSNQRGYVFPNRQEPKPSSNGIFRATVQRFSSNTGHDEDVFDVAKMIQV